MAMLSSGTLSDPVDKAATGSAPILLGLTAELTGQTLHADICKATMDADKTNVGKCPHPELNYTHPEAGTALHWAVAQGLRDAALDLLACKHFTLINVQRKSDGSTALHVAAAEGLIDVVTAILSHPDFYALSVVDRDGFTALHGAAFRGHAACARSILASPGFKGAAGVIGTFDIVRPAGHWAIEAAADYDMRTALHMAAAGGHAEICGAILSISQPELIGCDVLNRVGASALHMSARAQHTAASRAILESPNFPVVNTRDTRGYTALHWAAAQRSGEIVDAILARKDFTSVEAKDLRGRTAMDHAAELGHHEVRRSLLAYIGPDALRKV